MEFLVQGQKFMQFVSEQWELHRLEKEREKQDRVSSFCMYVRENKIKNVIISKMILNLRQIKAIYPKVLLITSKLLLARCLAYY